MKLVTKFSPREKAPAGNAAPGAAHATPAAPLGSAHVAPTRYESGVVVAREARRHPRRRVVFSASVATLDAERDGEGATYFLVTPASTLDVGEGGLGLQVETTIATGRRVLVDVHLEDGRTVECQARVAWTSSDTEGTQFVGVTFDSPLPGLMHSL
jgi:hypothetical protein